MDEEGGEEDTGHEDSEIDDKKTKMPLPIEIPRYPHEPDQITDCAYCDV